MPGERGAVCVGKRRPTWSMLKPGRPHAHRRRRDATNICAMKNIGVTRMQEFGETVFATFSARAAELGAINLGQGFPDTDGPNAMLERAQQEIARGNNQYPPGLGMPVLREAVACHQSRYGRTIDPATQVLITVGATEAITAAVTALVEPGEDVIVFEPYFDSYAAAISLAGGRRVAVSLKPAGDTWTLDTKAFEQAITPQTKLVICNSPHNPTGVVFDRAVLEEFARIVVAHDLLVVSDEVYEHLVFPPATHTHLASLPEMWERTVSVSSAAKTFNATGWKTGWAVGPQPLIKEVQRVKQYLSYVGAAPFSPRSPMRWTMSWPGWMPWPPGLPKRSSCLPTRCAPLGSRSTTLMAPTTSLPKYPRHSPTTWSFVPISSKRLVWLRYRSPCFAITRTIGAGRFVSPSARRTKRS